MGSVAKQVSYNTIKTDYSKSHYSRSWMSTLVGKTLLAEKYCKGVLTVTLLLC